MDMLNEENEEVEKLIQEKVRFDEMYNNFLSAELCGDCPTPLRCGECRYNNSHSMNGGDK